MRFLRRIAVILGFGKDDGHEAKDGHDDYNRNRSSDDVRRNRTNLDPIPGPRKGFSVPVQVPVERPVTGPVLVSCNGDGGVQGLGWYKARLRIDEDGDVADEFLEEVVPEMSAVMQDEQTPFPRFQANRNVREARVIHQRLSSDGKIELCVEFHGRMLLV